MPGTAASIIPPPVKFVIKGCANAAPSVINIEETGPDELLVIVIPVPETHVAVAEPDKAALIAAARVPKLSIVPSPKIYTTVTGAPSTETCIP